jgi:DNA polymerase-3 subunit beta
MEITMKRQYLLDRINRLKGITKLRSLMPVLRNVLVVAKPGGSIRATDLEISAITGFTAQVNEEINICISGGILAEVLAGITRDEVSLSLADDGKQLVIISGDFEAGISLADPEEFPEVEALNESEAFHLTGAELTMAIGKTLYAVSADEARYILTGLMMQVNRGRLIVCATDGFRLALWTRPLPEDPPDTPQIVIPGRNVKILKEIIGETARAGVVIEKNKVQFMTEAVTVIMRTLEGAFPDYEGIIDSNNKNVAAMNRADILSAVKRIEAIAKKESVVALQRGGGGITVSVESDIGYARERIECEYSSEVPLNLAVNGKFLLDALERLDSDRVIMRYHETYGAVQFDDVVASGEYICVIMPIRVDVPPLLHKKQEPDGTGHEEPPGPDDPGTKARRCRVCGCTDDDCSQCIEKTGEPCHWVEEDLCSACVSEGDRESDKTKEPKQKKRKKKEKD